MFWKGFGSFSCSWGRTFFHAIWFVHDDWKTLLHKKVGKKNMFFFRLVPCYITATFLTSLPLSHCPVSAALFGVISATLESVPHALVDFHVLNIFFNIYSSSSASIVCGFFVFLSCIMQVLMYMWVLQQLRIYQM